MNDDVIVVGAEPAGCTASKVLAEKGYEIEVRDAATSSYLG